MLSSQAVTIGLFDGIVGTNVAEFENELQQVARQVIIAVILFEMLS